MTSASSAVRTAAKIEAWKNAVEILALLAGGAWALWTFEFKEKLQPQAIESAVSLSVVMQAGPIVNGLLPVTVQFTIQNDSPRTAYLLDTNYMLLGRKIVPYEREADAFRRELNAHLRLSDEFERSSAVAYPKSALLSGGRLLSDWHLETHEIARVNRVIYVKADNYDEVVIVFKVASADSRFKIQAVPIINDPGVLGYDTYGVRVNGERYALGDNVEDNKLRVSEHFGVAKATSTLSLWMPMQPKAGSPGEVQQRRPPTKP